MGIDHSIMEDVAEIMVTTGESVTKRRNISFWFKAIEYRGFSSIAEANEFNFARLKLPKLNMKINMKFNENLHIGMRQGRNDRFTKIRNSRV